MTESRSELGFLLRFTTALQDGVVIRSVWKGWSRGSSGLRWETRRLIGDCGYAATSKHSEHAKLKDNWPHWKAGMLASGLIAAEVDIGDSKRRSTAQRSTPLDAAELVHWFSTKGVIAFLLFLSKHKTYIEARERNKAVLQSFLVHTLPAGVASRLLGQEPAHHRSLCERYIPAAGSCPHGPDMPKGGPPQVAIAKFLVRGFSSGLSCAFWKAWLCDVLSEVAEHIDQAVDTFADYDYHSSKDAFMQGPTGKKRRVLDPHCKEWVQRKVASGEHSSHAHAVKALPGLNRCQSTVWKNQSMGAYRAQLHLSFEHSLVIGLAVDASRVGRPSKELLCGAITDPVAKCHAVSSGPLQRVAKQKPHHLKQEAKRVAWQDRCPNHAENLAKQNL